MALIRKTNADAVPSSSQPAEVKLTVACFVDLLAPTPADAVRLTGFKLKLADNPGARVKIVKDIIKVKSGSVAIRFTLASAPGDKDRYYPIGITFVRENGCELGDEELLGLNYFPQRAIRLAGRTLSITAKFPARTHPLHYKFSIVVQRASDGKIGLIDPQIVNDSSDLRGP